MRRSLVAALLVFTAGVVLSGTAFAFTDADGDGVGDACDNLGNLIGN